MNRALVIIDVQNIMFSYKDGIHNKEEVLSNISEMIGKARKSQTPVIYIQHVIDDVTKTSDREGDWAIYADIYPEIGDTIIQKRSCDSFHETTLATTLEEENIEEVIYVGMQTDFCVDTTCRRSYSMGYKNILISDAHSTFDNEILTADKIIAHHNLILDGRFVETIKCSDFEF